jgi:hypothetical protein
MVLVLRAGWATVWRRKVLGMWRKCLLVGALSALLGCPLKPQKVEASRHILNTEGFAEALGAKDASAVIPWFRQGQSIVVRRHCPDCAVEGRIRALTIQSARVFMELAAELQRHHNLNAGPAGDFDFGPATCQDRCCKYETGLLDHATTYLVKACFSRDPKGVAITTLELLDA